MTLNQKNLYNIISLENSKKNINNFFFNNKGNSLL